MIDRQHLSTLDATPPYELATLGRLIQAKLTALGVDTEMTDLDGTGHSCTCTFKTAAQLPARLDTKLSRALAKPVIVHLEKGGLFTVIC